MIAKFSYALCALTSIVCAILLLRGYISSRARLILWVALCFVCLAINNILLVIDKATPEYDLSVLRSIPVLVGLGLLLYGMVWESK